MASLRSGEKGCWVRGGHCRRQWVKAHLPIREEEGLFLVAHLLELVFDSPER